MAAARVPCAAVPALRIRLPEGRNRRVALLGAGLLVLLVAGVIAAFAATGGDDERVSVGSTVEVAVVPQVVGLRTAQAKAALERAGLASVVERKASSRPAGTVTAAKPKPGSRVERGAAILLVVARARPAPVETQTAPTATEPATTEPTATEPPTETRIVEPEPAATEVPSVVEIGFVDAARMLEARGYVAETYVVASPRPRGLVLRQRPAPGTRLAAGRTVRLAVAAGTGSREPAELADYTGLPEHQARELLGRAGFTVRMLDRLAPEPKLIGVVLEQRPAAGKSLPVLTQVVLVVGR